MMEKAISEVEARRAKIMQGGGEVAIQKILRARGKMTPLERMDALFDAGTFHEIGLWATPLKTGFDIDNSEVPRDALIAGYGKVNGRTVYATSYDPTVSGGSQAAMQFEKLGRIMQAARDEGVPYVGVVDSGGRRIQDLFGRWSYRAPNRVRGCEEGALDMFLPPMASGVIPQISLVLGYSVAGTAYSPVMADFVFFRKKAGYMAVASPQLLKTVTFQDVTWDAIGGAELHATTTGTCDVLVETEKEAFDKCRDLLGFLPSNWKEKPPYLATGDVPNRREDRLAAILPEDPSQPYDMREVISLLVDNGDFFELHALYARSLVIGFGRLAGQPVGIVASNPLVNNGALDANACDKSARFIRTCNAFNIPLVFLADTPGFLPSAAEEQGREGLQRHAAKPVYAVCEATVPKITVYIRRCYGAGRLVMGSREMGVDSAFAWPAAEIRLGPENAADYKEPYFSGSILAVDDIIDPRDTRSVLVNTLDRLAKKQEPERPWKKHDLIPM